MASLPFAAAQERLASMVLGTARGSFASLYGCTWGFAGRAGIRDRFLGWSWASSHEKNCARNVASIRQKRAASVNLSFFFVRNPRGKYLLGLFVGATHKKIQTALLTLVLRLFFCAETGQVRKIFQ